MDKISHCPVCNELWHDTPIPEEYHENYSPPYFYSRVVACSTWESDRTLYYQCPDCATKFNLMGEPLTDKAS
jgi:hypothetical protein